eukprot:405145-Pyramimonas_sp.AAC.1
MVVHLAHLISRAGGQGVSDIGRDLVHSRNSSRALKRTLGFDIVSKECLMWVQCPTQTKTRKRAHLEPVAFLPIFEVLSQLFQKEGYDMLAHRSNRRLLCKSFWDNKIVQQYGGANVIPLRLFLDYARIDGHASALNMRASRPLPPNPKEERARRAEARGDEGENGDAGA